MFLSSRRQPAAGDPPWENPSTTEKTIKSDVVTFPAGEPVRPRLSPAQMLLDLAFAAVEAESLKMARTSLWLAEERDAIPCPCPEPLRLRPADLPEEYAMVVSGDCMAPQLRDGHKAHIDRGEKPKPGGLVVIHFRPECVRPGMHQAQLKRLVLAIPDRVTFPWTDHPKSTAIPALILEQLNPPKQLAVKYADVLAVHRCTGELAGEDRTYRMPPPRRRPAKRRAAR